MDGLLWIDMEMTGLDVNKEVPIEIAAIVTDYNFLEIETYHAVIQQPQEYLDRMDDWNRKQHGETGLTALVPNGKSPAEVQKAMEQLIRRHFEERPVIAGNSISQDRLFIDRHLPELSKHLHYRMLDVTAFKIIMNKKYQKTYAKKGAHRAVDDIRESIEELKFYLQFIKPS